MPDETDFLIPPDELSTLIDGMRQHVDRVVAEQPRAYMPLIHVVAVGNEARRAHAVFAIDTDFNEAEEKTAIMRRSAEALFERGLIPIAAALSSEAWIAIRSPDDPQLDVEPRHDPNRKEVIILMGAALHPPASFSDNLSITRDDKDRMQAGKWMGLQHPHGLSLIHKLFREYHALLLAKGDDVPPGFGPQAGDEN